MFSSSGVPPKESSFLINALLLHHYKRGAYYPLGGASEFAFHIIPVIQRAGGAVLVRAPVQRILLDQQGKACGKREWLDHANNDKQRGFYPSGKLTFNNESLLWIQITHNFEDLADLFSVSAWWKSPSYSRPACVSKIFCVKKWRRAPKVVFFQKMSPKIYWWKIQQGNELRRIKKSQWEKYCS